MRSLLVCLLLLPGFVFGQWSIDGFVKNENDLGVPDVSVRLDNQLATLTNQDGSFVIRDLPSGSFVLSIEPGIFRAVLNISGDTTVIIPYMSKYDIPEVQVRAMRPIADDPVTFKRYDRTELEALDQGRDVPFFLQYTPSTYVTSDAGTGIGYTGIRIRGSDPTRINVTINGVPLNDQESQTVFWVDLPDILSSTRDVVIQRGVGTSTNGAGAFGGSINLNTNRSNPDPYATFDGLTGSFNTQKASIAFGSGLLGNFTLDGRLSLIQSDGFIDRATADLRSYYLSGAYLGDKASLRFNVFSGHEITYQAWNGVPRDSLSTESGRTYNSAGAEKPGEPYDNEVDNYRQTHYQMFYNRSLGDGWNAGLTLHYTKGEGFFEQYKAGESLSDYGIAPLIVDGADPITTSDLVRQLWLDNDYYGAIINANYTGNQGMRLTFSGAISRYEGQHFGEVVWVQQSGNASPGQQYYDNDAVKTDWNVFGKISQPFADNWQLMLDLQVRGITYEFTGIDEDLSTLRQSVDHLFFNPKVGVTYNLSEAANIYASVAMANKEPSRDDYVERPRDMRLEAEQLIDFELGYRTTTIDNAEIGINGYFMSYKDQLLPTGELNEVGAYVRANVDKSYRLGIELDGSIYLNDYIGLYGNLTLSQNKIQDHREFVDAYDASFNYLGQEVIDRSDTDIALSPNVIASLGGQLNVINDGPHQLSLRLDGKYVGEQFIGNASDDANKLDAFHYSDVELVYTLGIDGLPDTRFHFGVRNAYDSEYETNAWSYRYLYDGAVNVDQGFYPQAGRNYYLRLVTNF